MLHQGAKGLDHKKTVVSQTCDLLSHSDDLKIFLPGKI